MNHLFKTAKHNAKAALGGNFGRAIAIVLLLAAISILFVLTETALTLGLGVASFTDYLGTPDYYLDNLPSVSLPALLITSLTSLLALLVMVPLGLGEKGWYLGLTYGRAEEITGVFLFFESLRRMARAVWLSVLLGVRYLLWAVLLFAPGLVLLELSLTLAAQGGTSADLMMAAAGSGLAVLVTVFGGVLLWVVSQRYFLASYILCADRCVKASQAIRLSVAATRGYGGEIAFFRLSFLGWHLLSLLVLPLLYVRPYVSTAKAIFARYLIEKAGVVPRCPELTSGAEEAV